MFISIDSFQLNSLAIEMNRRRRDQVEPAHRSLSDLDHNELVALQQTIISCAEAAAPGTKLNDLAELVVARMREIDAPRVAPDTVVEEIRIVKKKRSSRFAANRAMQGRRQVVLARLAELDAELQEATTRSARQIVWQNQMVERRKLQQKLHHSKPVEPDTELAVNAADAIDSMLTRKAESSDTSSDNEDGGVDHDQENIAENSSAADIAASADSDLLPLGQRELARYRKAAGQAIARRRLDRDEVMEELKGYLRAVRVYFEHENEIRAAHLEHTNVEADDDAGRD